MEPLTHALSGAVIGQLLRRRSGTSAWLPLWAALVAASPDLDVFFVHTPLEYIAWHRGITHSLAGGLVLAFILAFAFALLCRLLPRLKENTPPLLLWLWGYLLILHHIWLDCMNSYGTQVFLPFSDTRIRWNALFIVDPFLLLPLGLGLLLARKRRAAIPGLMVGLLLWTIVYPLGALGLRLQLEHHLAATPPASLQQTPNTFSAGLPEPAPWADSTVHLVPDAFTPFHWKLILDRRTLWNVAGYTLFQGTPHGYTAFAKPPQPLWDLLGQTDATFHEYQRFALFPALDETIHAPETPGNPTEYVFSDLRFGSTIAFVDNIQSQRDGKPMTFRIMARIAGDGQLTAVRFVTTRGAGGDSGWHSPHPPRPNPFLP